MNNNEFHKRLKELMDSLAHKVYDATENFPKTETFGITSQIRRSALSIILNYLEGYGRRRINYIRSFLEISYGSLKETQYLIYFSFKRKYLLLEDYNRLTLLADEVGKMLWGIITKL